MPTPIRQSSAITLWMLLVLLLVIPPLGLLVGKTSATLSIGIVVALLIFIGSFVNAQFAIYVLIFATLLSPEFGSRSTSGSGVTIRLDDFLLLLIGFSQLAKTAVYKQVGLFSWTPINRYITYYMLACIISTGVGILSGRVRSLTGFFFVLKYFEYFIVYFMVINNLDSKAQAKRYLVAILLTAAIVSLVAIAQIPKGGRVAAPFEGEDGEPNTLGGYLLLIASAVSGLLFVRDALDRLTHKLLLGGLLGLLTIPILFTLSRATWLAAVPAMLGFLFLSDRKMLMGLIIAAGIVVAPVVLPQAVWDRILYTTEEQQNKWARRGQESIGGVTFDTSTSARIREWKAAVEDFPQHPIIGFGVTGWHFIDAQYFKVLIETGFVGIITFFMLLWAIIRHTWHTYKTAREPLFKGLALGFLVGTFSMMVHATMTNTFIIVRIMEPFCLLMAIVIAVPSLEETEMTTEGAPEQSRENRQHVPLPGSIVRSL